MFSTVGTLLVLCVAFQSSSRPSLVYPAWLLESLEAVRLRRLYNSQQGPSHSLALSPPELLRARQQYAVVH